MKPAFGAKYVADPGSEELQQSATTRPGSPIPVYNLRRHHSWDPEVHFFLGGFAAGLQRRKSVCAKNAFDTMGVLWSFDYTHIARDFTFITSQTNPGNNVADGIGGAFLW